MEIESEMIIVVNIFNEHGNNRKYQLKLCHKSDSSSNLDFVTEAMTLFHVGACSSLFPISSTSSDYRFFLQPLYTFPVLPSSLNSNSMITIDGCGSSHCPVAPNLANMSAQSTNHFSIPFQTFRSASIILRTSGGLVLQCQSALTIVPQPEQIYTFRCRFSCFSGFYLIKIANTSD